MTIGSKFHQGLLRYSFDFKPFPCLAKSWTISTDGLTYTFTLQDGATWHDGAEFTADDVVFSTTKLLPQTLLAGGPLMRDRRIGIEAMDAPGGVHAEAPFGAFISAFLDSCCPMMPTHIYDRQGLPEQSRPTTRRSAPVRSS